MKKGLAIIILTIISTANLTANDILTLFSKWENASKIDRIHIGNELLEKGTEEGLLMGKYTYGRSQAIESEARIYDMMSCYYYIKNQFDDALSMALMALPLCERSNDDNLLADCINNIGILYQRKGLFGQAINYMERVYKLDLKAKDKQGMSSTMNNLATLYLATGQAETALGYILPAIEMERERGDRERLAIRLGLASDIWLEMGHSDRALVCVEEAYKLDSEDHREGKKAIRLSQKAAVLIAGAKTLPRKSVCCRRFLSCRRRTISHRWPSARTSSDSSIIKVSCTRHAEKAYRTACEQATKAGSDYVKKKALSGLWLCQKHLGKLQDALHTLEEYTQLSEKIADDRADSAVEDFRVRYETKEKEERLIHEQEMSKTRLTVLICLSLFSALLIILLVLTYRMLRIKRRQAKILSKNQEVKNKLLSLVLAISNTDESDQIKEIVSDIETMDDVPKMTGREMEVVKLCCDGLTSKEIAGKLNVSVRTVDAHKGNIFKKLKISSTVELIRYAVKTGLYTADNQYYPVLLQVG